jgi:hypothetical protein
MATYLSQRSPVDEIPFSSLSNVSYGPVIDDPAGRT